MSFPEWFRRRMQTPDGLRLFVIGIVGSLWLAYANALRTGRIPRLPDVLAGAILGVMLGHYVLYRIEKSENGGNNG